MTKTQEIAIINQIDSEFEAHNLSNVKYLFPKDIYIAFGYSRQLLSKWRNDKNISLDGILHLPNRFKYDKNQFRYFLIKIRTKSSYLKYEFLATN